MRIKAQATTLAVSVAVMASFLSGAVAFSQMQLIPDMFEKRTNDLDLMTRAESRADNTAGNFVTQAAWFDLSNITYYLGQNKGVGVTGEDQYEGGWGTEGPTDDLLQNYFTEVEEQLQNQFEGYSGNQLEYSRCDVEIDPNIDVDYDISNRNPEISSGNNDGLVSVECRNNELNINYEASQSSYEIDMNNNRFPYLVKIVQAGMYNGSNPDNGFFQESGKPGAEQTSDILKSKGRWSDGTDDGYWNNNVLQRAIGQDAWAANGPYGVAGCYGSENAAETATSEAENKARSQAQKMENAIIWGGGDYVGNPGRPHSSRGAIPAMNIVQGGSQVCIAGLCSPEMPLNINWGSIDVSANVNDQNWVIDTYVETEAQYSVGELGETSCPCQNGNIIRNGDSNCDAVNRTYKAKIDAKWYYDYIDAEIKAEETDSTNEIPTDSGWQKLKVKEDFYYDFPEPNGWNNEP